MKLLEQSPIHQDQKCDGGYQGLRTEAGENGGGLVFDRDRVSVWESGEVLEMDGGEGCPAWECAQLGI